VYQTYRSHGVEAGMQRFQQVIGLEEAPPEQPQGESTPEMLEGWARIADNLEFFLAHGVRPLTGYVPDVAAFRVGPARIVVGIGEASGGQLAHRAAVALADRLDSPPVTFPCDHGAMVSRRREFAKTLHEILIG
jgi:hypothetical protein